MIATWPEIVKANRQEVERLLGRPLEDDAALLAAAKEMHSMGAAIAIITADERGAIAVAEEAAWQVSPPPIVVVSAVGAGDALLAGLVLKLAEGAGLEEGLRWGSAAGAAACLTPGTQLCHRKDVERLLPKVRVKQLRRELSSPVRRRAVRSSRRR